MMLHLTERMRELYDLRDKATSKEEIERINQMILKEDKKDPCYEKVKGIYAF